MHLEGIAAVVIFLGSLVLIFSEKLNRTIAALGGAALMIAAGIALDFYPEDAAIAAIDFNTLGLLLGMMILVSMLEPTGFFQYLAVVAARASKGRPRRLMLLLAAITTVLSMFLDNVTTVVLIAPVTILICEILGVSSLPFLMTEAVISNIGGVATLVGDPPNVLIASAAELSFTDFLVHSLPIVLVVWVGVVILLQYLFRAEFAVRPRKVKAVMKLNPAETLNQPRTVRQLLAVLGAAITFFLVHHILHVDPSLVALDAAALALVWVRPDVSEVLKRIEWSVLVFFAALFVMVGGLDAAGVLQAVIGLLEPLSRVPAPWFGIGMIWAVAGLSAVVDNVPITIALIPVIHGLGQNGMDTAPLWWALAFGAGFGGTGTIIGSTANIIVTNLSERTRTPITAAQWNRRGLPVMLLTCLIASVMYAMLYSTF